MQFYLAHHLWLSHQGWCKNRHAKTLKWFLNVLHNLSCPPLACRILWSFPRTKFECAAPSFWTWTPIGLALCMQPGKAWINHKPCCTWIYSYLRWCSCSDNRTLLPNKMPRTGRMCVAVFLQCAHRTAIMRLRHQSYWAWIPSLANTLGIFLANPQGFCVCSQQTPF